MQRGPRQKYFWEMPYLPQLRNWGGNLLNLLTITPSTSYQIYHKVFEFENLSQFQGSRFHAKIVGAKKGFDRKNKL